MLSGEDPATWGNFDKPVDLSGTDKRLPPYDLFSEGVESSSAQTPSCNATVWLVFSFSMLRGFEGP